MIRENDSITSTVDRLIDKIEIECELRRGGLSKVGETSGSSEEKVAGLAIKRTTDSDASGISCRICYDTSPVYPIIYPCRCKGTMGAIHLECLERWLEEGNRNSCELCGHEFVVERTPRYKALRSIVIWMCLRQNQHQLYVRSLRIDFLRCSIVTPITIACSYACVVAADFYSANNYDNFPPARWTTYSLLAMMIIVIFSYFAWMYMAIQYHQRVWFYWWQKTSTVKVKLPEMGISSSMKNSIQRYPEIVETV